MSRHTPVWRLLMLTTAVLLLPHTGSAQQKTADTPSSARWEKDIAAIDAKLSKRPTQHADVVFVGSSSIRLWDLQKSFPNLDAVNHGFGGSQIDDSVHYFDRLVTAASPRVIVLYAGDNDISAGKSPEVVLRDFQRFMQQVDSQVPKCERVVFIAIKPSLKRWHLKDTIVKANALVAAACAEHPKAVYADIWPPSLNDAGEPRPELLASDQLHLTPAGYEAWTSVIAPLLVCHRTTAEDKALITATTTIPARPAIKKRPQDTNLRTFSVPRSFLHPRIRNQRSPRRQPSSPSLQ